MTVLVLCTASQHHSLQCMQKHMANEKAVCCRDPDILFRLKSTLYTIDFMSNVLQGYAHTRGGVSVRG